MAIAEMLLDNTTAVIEIVTIIGFFIGITEWRFKTLIKPISDKLDEEIQKAEKQHDLLFDLYKRGV